ncbi:NAD(P)-dependent oxidoreductase [Mumia sp. ZJ1417]|uniref:NAD(P)-dependent oxidoreductase n=1 Tax=Mumia sp. ZJ1417 TaxID=2708082 RepID=UPI001AB045BF|nr:NAD(P)-dependent oxidoreductase [Mumia sp. ZJ1417]
MATVAVLGVGEAGTALVADLLGAGVTVRVHDPVVATPGGATGCRDDADAVAGAALVISVNSAADALDAARVGGPACAPGTVWADLNTASPQRKSEVADVLPPEVRFADVALMSIVPGHGIRTPMLVSGPGAEAYAAFVRPLGTQIDVLAGPPGVAAQRKLMRSVLYKGMAAAVIEAVAAGRAAGLEDWIRAEIARELDQLSAGSLDRFEKGSRAHAVRRAHEMDAAVQMLDTLGVPGRVSAASRDWLNDLRSPP